MKIFYGFLEDRPRWILWWPVGFGTGISIYFSLTFEPPIQLIIIIFAFYLLGIGAALYAWRDRICIFLPSIIFLCIGMGFAVAQIRTHLFATPFLENKIEEITLRGRIIDIEEQPKNRRITLDNLTFSKEAQHLKKVRITVPINKPFMSMIGDYVELQSSLLPLSEPVSLNGYNFRRQAYFQGISATGRVNGSITTIKKHDHLLWLASARHQLTQTIRHRLPGQSGEIASALITGDRSGIQPSIRQAFTDAGLAHILAISGLHLTLVAGLVFLTFRRGLALISPLAENYPIKKWAAMIVIIATLGYLAISGFGIPGQRAFIMISIIMLGIMLDRNPLSMRLVAIAASGILMLRPESLLSASFQLSFAAVIGLIAAYEDGWKPLRQWSIEGGFIRRFIAYGSGLIATTLIATLATTPYTLALFNRITLQAIVGNLLAIPLTSLVIMPAATFCVLSLPFGNMNFSFEILSFGISLLIDIAQMVASWPGAAIMISTPHPAFLGFVTYGGLWICIWKSPWRWAGGILCGIGCLTLLNNQPADIFAAGDASVIAYRKDDTLYVSNMKRGLIYSDQWMKELGLKHKKDWPEDLIKVRPVLLLRSHSYPLKISRQMCQAKGFITNGYAWRECNHLNLIPRIFVDRYTLKRDGTYQIWIQGNEVSIKSIKRSLGIRPWTSMKNN